MTVHLVGAGPGDPGLITARGLDLVRGCEALVYDRLVAPELVDEAPAGALIYTREELDQDEINELLDLPVEWIQGRYASWDLGGKWLAIAATPDRGVNRRVKEDAERLGIFCNVADDPELCSLILPAVHRVDPIAIAVSTGGASPALAQRIRSEIAELVGPAHARLARELRELRPWAKENLPTYEARKEYFEELVSRSLS